MAVVKQSRHKTDKMHGMHEGDDTVIIMPTKHLSTQSKFEDKHVENGLASFD